MKLKKRVVAIACVLCISLTTLVISCVNYIDNQNIKIKNLNKQVTSLKDTNSNQNKQINSLVTKVNKLNKALASANKWRIGTVRIGVCSLGLSVKSYMSYKAITDIDSKQYKMIHSSNIRLCEDGLLRTPDGYIGVALASKYGKVGDKFIMQLSTGKLVKVIKLDEKANRHTTDGCYTTHDHSIAEMIIDVNKARKSYRKAITMGDFNYSDFFNGTVIDVYQKK